MSYASDENGSRVKNGSRADGAAAQSGAAHNTI
jgi:hypothetical protein